MKAELRLAKQASGKGGDRYEGNFCGENLVVYLPQAFTRQNGTPKPSVTLDIE